MKKLKRVVVKIGTRVLTSADGFLDTARIKELVCQVSEIKKKGIGVILVTSGAIGSGLSMLGIKKKPSDIATLQAAAAIGQNRLMHVYSESFKDFGIMAAQILLTQEDFNDRKRYLNIKHTVDKLLSYGAVPVINENDTVATEELRCGDNDRLSQLVADLCQADELVFLTDVGGLLDEEGKTISFVQEIGQALTKLAGKSSSGLGTGGMRTKLEAAKSATQAGIECVIADGRRKNILTGIILEQDTCGTLFKCGKGKFAAKKRWIAFSSQPKGSVVVDDGAASAIKEKNKSLLASGISAVEGEFDRGDTVRVVTKLRKEFARGLCNYSSKDLLKIKGEKSADFKKKLGYAGRDEAIHKDNLVIL